MRNVALFLFVILCEIEFNLCISTLRISSSKFDMEESKWIFDLI